MNLPDVKGEARRQLDRCSDGILGIVQIVADDTGNVTTCIGGIPEIIVNTFTQIMKDHHQLRDLIGSAWLNAGGVEVKTN